MVGLRYQGQGVGERTVRKVAEQAKRAGCEWLHAGLNDNAVDFYCWRCGSQKTNGVLRYLS